MQTESTSFNSLSDDDLELLGYMLEDEGVAIAEQPLITPRAPDDELLLSFAQERVWFLDQWDPGNPAFNIPFAVRLTGNLVLDAFQRSLDEIVRRHEALRTTFPAIDGRPSQQIAAPQPVALALIDLQHLPASAHDAEVKRLIMAGAQTHFNLAEGPLLRAELLRLAPHEHVFLLTIHHIVFDAWSVGLFLRELTLLYDAFVHGQPAPLEPLPVQYADFSIWQRNWLQGEVLEQQLAYWKRQLGGTLPILELPGDYPRPPAMSYQGAIYTLDMPAALTERLHTLGQQAGATLFMTLFAAFQTLLYRYSGEDDIITGSLIANRDSLAVEGLLGYFINTLLLRADLSGNPTFRELLRRVRELTLEAYAHQTVPFEQLVEELKPQRDPAHTPLFQVMFILQNAPIPSRAQHDLQVQFLRVDNKTSKFDLTLSMTELPDGLRAVAEYNTDIFEEATMARMMGHYQTLLETIAANADQPINGLSLLSAAERAELAAWQAPAVPFSEHASIHELFEAQVVRTPNALALVSGSQQLTYAELNAQANQLAYYLRGQGLKPDDRVGVCIERSPDLIVALLGILKAGGAYVPLDPAYPTERLAFMLADAAPLAVITDLEIADFRSQIVDWPGAIYNLQSTIYNQSTDNPAPMATPSNLAYVIYTSGSTGQPKGVLIEHRSLVNYTEAARAAYGISTSDRVLQFASINFDASVEEIYTALTSGATLVLRNEQMVETMAGFLDTCRAWQISVLSLPTAFWHELVVQLVADNLALPDSLRVLIIGGERALPERVALWQERVAGRVQLFNTYGPTETTVVATIYRVPAAATPGRQRDVPIGRPLPNLQAYVLDQAHNPLPVGVPGELYIGGAALARGYLNQPELTEERFVPFWGQGSGVRGQESAHDAGHGLHTASRSLVPDPRSLATRLYKTGDLVRWRADGQLEFLGRVDQQVKIRGFRVEPGEVAAALRQHPAVADALVVAREDLPGERRLVAYIVKNEEVRVKNSEHESSVQTSQLATRNSQLATRNSQLATFLKTTLPDYMIPSAYVALERLPLTANGKINLRALPAPDMGRERAASRVAPRTPTEEQVATLWMQVLRLEQVGVYDNFFELGGHSLLATQIIARVRSNFQVDLPLRHLFSAPTVAGVAETIETIRWAAQGAVAAAHSADEAVEEGEL